MYTEELNTYVQHFLNEHRRLHGYLASARAGLERGNLPLSAIAEQLRQLREELVCHFAEEENGGCMEEATVRMPRLADEAEQLREEHGQLLRMLDDLIARGDSSAAGQSRAEYCEQFEQFLQRLRGHEARENQILQSGFNIDLD